MNIPPVDDQTANTAALFAHRAFASNGVWLDDKIRVERELHAAAAKFDET